MVITIGTISNELLKYANVIELKYVGYIPTLKAFLSTKSGITKVYVNIAQVGDNLFSAYADPNDTSGLRFVPTGSTSRPFVRESERAHELFGGKYESQFEVESIIENVEYSDVMTFLFNILLEYDLINVTDINQRISTFGFDSPKLIRAIDKAFNSANQREGTVMELFSTVVCHKSNFTLEGLRSKDLKVLEKKLADRGTYITFDNDTIIDVTFRRK